MKCVLIVSLVLTDTHHVMHLGDVSLTLSTSEKASIIAYGGGGVTTNFAESGDTTDLEISDEGKTCCGLVFGWSLAMIMAT